MRATSATRDPRVDMTTAPRPKTSTNAYRLTVDTMWAAVEGRDAAFDGRFVLAVATTGIYCRPSCPARHAKRENVSFFDTPAEAEAAGYRACKRCRPDAESPDKQRANRIARACRLIEEAETPPSLAALASAAGLSPHHFHRAFKAALGVTPKAYADAVRVGRVRANLATSSTVTEAIHESGYGTSGRFYERSDEVLGMTPKSFRAGGKDAAVRFALGATTLGAVLVAASDKGICAILLGDDPQALTKELRRLFPSAMLIADDKSFADLVVRVVRFVDSPATGLDLPLDIRGTAFQRRVWEALQKIPMGATASYTEIAEAIGQPSAARAVARACASNRLAVAIPCHRVVKSDGGLSGYRWGIALKRQLLDLEQANASPGKGRK